MNWANYTFIILSIFLLGCKTGIDVSKPQCGYMARCPDGYSSIPFGFDCLRCTKILAIDDDFGCEKSMGYDFCKIYLTEDKKVIVMQIDNKKSIYGFAKLMENVTDEQLAKVNISRKELEDNIKQLKELSSR